MYSRIWNYNNVPWFRNTVYYYVRKKSAVTSQWRLWIIEDKNAFDIWHLYVLIITVSHYAGIVVGIIIRRRRVIAYEQLAVKFKRRSIANSVAQYIAHDLTLSRCGGGNERNGRYIRGRGNPLCSFYIDRYENSRSPDSVIKLMERGELREEHRTFSRSLSLLFPFARLLFKQFHASISTLCSRYVCIYKHTGYSVIQAWKMARMAFDWTKAILDRKIFDLDCNFGPIPRDRLAQVL